MKIYKVSPLCVDSVFEGIGADGIGSHIMRAKLENLYFEVRELDYRATTILKQEALSIGAEFVTPREQILHKGAKKGLLIANLTQIKILTKKLKMQDFGLKELAKVLESHIRGMAINSNNVNFLLASKGLDSEDVNFSNTNLPAHPAIMAIVNVTDDSFVPSSRNTSTSAIERIYDLLNKGIPYIDVGAASSRPNARILNANEEIARLQEICKEVKSQNLAQKAIFSIDTYNPKTAEFALRHGFRVINDVSGFAHKDMAKVNAEFGTCAIIMHIKGNPQNMQNFCTYKHIFSELDLFFEAKIEEILRAGGRDIILDIGFGFAKNVEQNIILSSNIGHFKHFGFPLLLGASNKSTIGEITTQAVEHRLSGTLALHLLGVLGGADILRVHDEVAHIDMLKIYQAMRMSRINE